jgi:hypothetical protein
MTQRLIDQEIAAKARELCCGALILLEPILESRASVD